MITNPGSPVVCFKPSGCSLTIQPPMTPAGKRSLHEAEPAGSRSLFSGRPGAGLSLLAPALLCLGMVAPAEALVIDVTYDTSVAQSAFATQITADVGAVVSGFEGAISNNATVSIGVGWGEVGGASIPNGDISSSTNNLTSSYSYGAVQTLLNNASPSLKLTTPAINPLASTNFYIPDAEARALGLSPSPPAGQDGCHCDGFIGFSNAGSVSFAFPGTTVSSGTYSFIAAAEHEIEEVLGRASGLTTLYGGGAEPLDELRYSAPGVGSFSSNASAYASINGGTTGLGSFNSAASGGDRGDWAVASPDTNTDVQDAVALTGTVLGLSTSDQDLLGALGWDITNEGTLFGAPLFSGSFAPLGAADGVNEPVSTPEPAGLSVLLGAAGLLFRLRHSRPV